MYETPEGFLVCVGVPIARTGEMEYGRNETPIEPGPDGITLISREEKEVFRPETIASFQGKAITISHPAEFVSPENWSRLSKGILQNVRRGEGDTKDDLIADLLITDRMAIALVKNGLREVSCGYEANYTQTGEGQGVQTEIIGNHLALVEEGRAGSAYAINDHKGVSDMGKLKAKIQSIFSKAQDEALKLVEDESGKAGKTDDKKAAVVTDADKEDKKDDAKDEADKEDKKDDAKDAEGDADAKDAMAGAYDEVVQMVKDLTEKVAKLGESGKPSGDADKEDKVDEKKDDSKDEGTGSVEERLSAIEAALAKLLENKTGDADEEEEESEDDDFEESTMVGDTAARLEILAPGTAPARDEKSTKILALKTAFGTAEGKKVILAVNGGKAPTYDSAEKIDMLFVAASEVLKQSRTSELSETKRKTHDSEDDSDDDNRPVKGPITPEELNRRNAKFYASRNSN